MRLSARFLLPVVAGVLGASGMAIAAPVTVDFTVTASAGPLSGSSSSGWFSFDDAIVPSGGGSLSQSGLLTGLSFTWNSIAYTAATANTGGLGFSAAGDLTGFAFGNNCGDFFCAVVANHEQWYVVLVEGFSPQFVYSTPGYDSIALDSSVQWSVRGPNPVPEPATISLLGLGLAGAGLATARRRRR